MDVVKSFRADIKELDNVLAFVKEEISSYVSNKILFKINIAIEELFVNIANYAYEKNEENDDNNLVDISINVDLENKNIVITFVDSGAKFNPISKEDPCIDLPAEERKVGGLGIYIVKKTVDKIDYKYIDNKNVLTIEKSYEKGEEKK